MKKSQLREILRELIYETLELVTYEKENFTGTIRQHVR
jgi:hypothetical protein